MLEGIIAGLISAIIFSFSMYFGQKMILPRIVAARKGLPDVSGEWQILDPDNGDIHLGRGTITQRGTKIIFQYTFDQDRQGEESGRRFTAKGQFYSEQIVLTYEEETNNGFVVGTGVLLPIGPGREMTGRALQYSRSSQEFETRKVSLRRIKNK